MAGYSSSKLWTPATSWREVDPRLIPPTLDGEAGFAASNSAMCLGPNGKVWIGTGGSASQASRLFVRDRWGAAWSTREVPLVSGPTQGIFSIAAQPATALVVAVGGDYRPEAKSTTTAAYSTDGGATWQAAEQPPGAFRSAVVENAAGVWLATGPSGTDVSRDGVQWQAISDIGFHTLARSPNQVYAAGSHGRFAVLRVGPRDAR